MAAGVVIGLIAERRELATVTASAVLGVSFACWLSWSDDATGLFVVGWAMITVGAVAGAFALIWGAWALKSLLTRRAGRA